MQRVKFYARGVWVDKYLAEWVTIIMIMVHIGLGTAILVGGATRFTPPSYNPLVAFTFDNVWIWGMWILGCAFLMSVPFRTPNILGLWGAMLWHWVWMASFAIAVLNYDNASATPIPAYGGFAMICTALLTARVIDNSKG